MIRITIKKRPKPKPKNIYLDALKAIGNYQPGDEKTF